MIENRWCQKTLFRDANGNIVSSHDTKAVQFCIIGALYKTYPLEYLEKSNVVRERIAGEAGSVIEWNDDKCRKKEEVVELLKELDL